MYLIPDRNFRLKGLVTQKTLKIWVFHFSSLSFLSLFPFVYFLSVYFLILVVLLTLLCSFDQNSICLFLTFNFQIKISYGKRQECLCKYDRLMTCLYFQILWRHLDCWKILNISDFIIILAIPCRLKVTFVALKPYCGSTESYAYWLENIFTCPEMLPLFSNRPISSLFWNCMVGDPVKTQIQWLSRVLHPNHMW